MKTIDLLQNLTICRSMGFLTLSKYLNISESSMDPHIQAIDTSSSLQTVEDAPSTSSVHQPPVTWQGRKVVLEQSQRTEGDHSLVGEEQRNPQIASLLPVLPSADVARSTQTYPSLWKAPYSIDLEHIKTLALALGLPQEFLLSIEGSSCLSLDEATLSATVGRLLQIEQNLPETVRNKTSSTVHREWQNPSWLREFLQTAYDTQLLIAFGKAAGIGLVQSFADQVRRVRQWLDTSPHITTLHLQNRNLLLLPQEVARLTSLTELNVSQNQITKLPSLCQLTNLQDLDVSYNQITALPDLSSLTKLQDLDVRQNRLTRVPDMSQFSNLQELKVSDNQITELPGLTSLTKLELLYINGNPIVQLPDMRQLSSLRSFSAHHTQLTGLPNSLFQLPHIQSIFAFSCPNVAIPVEQQPLIQALRSRGGFVCVEALWHTNVY